MRFCYSQICWISRWFISTAQIWVFWWRWPFWWFFLCWFNFWFFFRFFLGGIILERKHCQKSIFKSRIWSTWLKVVILLKWQFLGTLQEGWSWRPSLNKNFESLIILLMSKINSRCDRLKNFISALYHCEITLSDIFYPSI